MTRREIEIAATVVLALVLLGGGGYMVSKAIDRRRMAELLRAAAEAAGVDPDVAEAIGRVESNLDPTQVNKAGRDGLRGGAYGATQITLTTARAYGFNGTPEELLASPELQAQLTARILAAAPYKDRVEDFGSWWNAGVPSASDPRIANAPDGTPRARTRDVYIPGLVAAYSALAGTSEAA